MTISFVFVGFQFICIAAIMLTGEIFPSDKIKMVLLVITAVPGFVAMYSFRFRFNIFPEIPEFHKLNISGIYKYVRHPMYTSVILMTLLWVWNDYSLMRFAIWVILLIDLIFKLKYEERLLMKAYPEYEEYIKKTKMLIPFLY
ncbi:MAG: isoprenylcysteine carboxylmethyltransferase family protein [Ignavibacteria bacterium]